MTSEAVVQIFLTLAITIFVFNIVLGLYVALKMMRPQKVRFALLWTFYILAILTTLMQIALTFYLALYPEYIENCFIYRKTPASILHATICSGVVACGFIAIATMHQIRYSLRVIMQELSYEQAQKRIKIFNFFAIILWVIF